MNLQSLNRHYGVEYNSTLFRIFMICVCSYVSPTLSIFTHLLIIAFDCYYCLKVQHGFNFYPECLCQSACAACPGDFMLQI